MTDHAMHDSRRPPVRSPRSSFVRWLAVVSLLGVLAFGATEILAQIKIQVRGGNINGNVVVQMKPKPVRSTSRLLIENRERTKALSRAVEDIRGGDFENGLQQIQYLLETKDDSFVPIRLEDSEIDTTPVEEPEPQPQPGGIMINPNGMLETVHAERPERPKVRYRSLKSQALDVLAELPPEGRKVYNTIAGPKAERLLREGRQERDISILEETVRLYFFTRAGHEAAYLLGTYRLDHGEPFAASQLFTRLLDSPLPTPNGWQPWLSLKLALAEARSGQTEEARKTLRKLKARTPGAGLRLAGRMVPLPLEGEDELEWLENTIGWLSRDTNLAERWMLLRGSADGRTKSDPASLIWVPEWRASTFEHAPGSMLESAKLKERIPVLQQRLKELTKQAIERDELTLPMAHSLLIDDLVVIRDVSRTVQAFDVATGDLAWQSYLDPPLLSTILDRPMPQQWPKNVRVPSNNAPPIDAYIAQRLWRDLSTGTLSSNGRHIYAVEATRLPSVPQTSPQSEFAPAEHSMLAAYSKERDGSLMWLVGGPESAVAAADDPLAGHFFLGPPLPIGEKLYVLAENDGEVRLLCLTERQQANGLWTVEFDWAQALATPESDIVRDPLRRTSGLTPALSGDIMVCCTSAGAVVAVDLSRRLLLWGFQYRIPKERDEDPFQARIMALRRANTPSVVEDDRWVDSTPIIDGDRVLVTPQDSDALYCLSLADGETPLWQRGRGEGIYLAGVDNGIAVVVGRTQVTAYRVADGSAAWSEPIPIPLPSGRGYLSDGFYHLPLSTGAIAAIDIEKGVIQAMSRGPEGFVPGNLVAVDGRLISQSIGELVGFAPLSELKTNIESTLAKTPDDPEALAMRGELRLVRGATNAGLEDIRRSLSLQDDPRVRATLIERLLEVFRTDPVAGLKHREELARLTRGRPEELRFRFWEAIGLEEDGQQLAAYERFVDLALQEETSSRLARMTGALSIDPHHWARVRAGLLYREADEETRRSIETLMNERLTAALVNGNTERLAEVVTLLRGQSNEDEARANLVLRFNQNSETLRLHQHLSRLRAAGAENLSAFATVRLIELHLREGRSEEAVPLVRELKTRFAEVEVVDGQTGAEIASHLIEENPQGLAAELELTPGETQTVSTTEWPRRRIEATTTRKSRARGVSFQTFTPLTTRYPQGPFYEGWSFALGQRRQSIIGFDSNGVQQFEAQLDRRVNSASAMHYRISGRVLALTVGDHLSLFDLYGSQKKPIRLWNTSLAEDGVGSPVNSIVVRMPNNPAGFVRTTVDRMGRPIGDLAALTEELVVYQRGTRLHARETLSGNPVWEVRGLPRGCELHSDGERIYALENDAERLLIFRVADGQSLGSRRLDLSGDRVLKEHTTDYLLLLSTPKKNGEAKNGEAKNGDKQNTAPSRLRAVRLSTGETAWEREVFQPLFDTAPDGGIAMVEPSDETTKRQGRFTILDETTGQVRMSTPIEASSALTNIYLFADEDSYTLGTYGPETDKKPPAPGTRLTRYPIGLTAKMLNGPMYTFDRETGEQIWATRLKFRGIDAFQVRSLPVLVFATRIHEYRQGPNQPRRLSITKYDHRVIDRRTGRVIEGQLHSSGANLSRYVLETDPVANTITMKSYSLESKLQVTSKPLGEPVTLTDEEAPNPEAPPKPDVEKKEPEKKKEDADR